MVHGRHHKGYGKQFTLYRLALLRETWPDVIRSRSRLRGIREGFYAKMGFHTIKMDKDGFADGIDKYTMHLPPKPL